MQPFMSGAERALLESFLRHSDNYLEFGSGGSTVAAARLVRHHVTAVDSSRDWLANVEQACLAEGCPLKPVLIHADIGPIGAWGMPTDPAVRDRWPSYYEAPWEHPAGLDADLFLVDGRFRVACFMKTLLNCQPDSRIMIHDFASRVAYHVIREVAREIASAEDLSVFVPIPGRHRSRIHAILMQHRFEAA
jgi:hypothetical protein